MIYLKMISRKFEKYKEKKYKNVELSVLKTTACFKKY